MSRLPRLLPLVGVAIGGVVAVNALAGARAVPDLFSATRAAAEEALHPKAGKGKAPQSPAPAEPGNAAASPIDPAAAPAPPRVCAPSAADLAKAAGLSPAELQVLQSLQARRGQIEDRAKDLDTEVQLLNAAQAKLDSKLQSMNGLKAAIQAMLGQADQKTQAEVDRLVVVYSKMKPADAAAVMAQLDDKVRIPIAAAMKPAVLSAILGKMGTMDAKVLTEKLAHRFAQVQTLADAANAPPGVAPAPPADPKAKPAAKEAKPQAQADEADPADDQADGASTAKAKPAPKPAAKPRHLARAAAKKPVAAKPKAKPVEAKADAPALPPKPQAYDSASKDKTPSPAPAKAG